MRVVVSTGEPSGRLLARLVEAALTAREPGIELVLLDAGRARGAVFGFAEGLRAVPALRRELSDAERHITGLVPDLVLLVGFSAYHLALGRRCRRRGLRVGYLAPPQLWAWGGWRAGELGRAADLVVCLYGFEFDWLRAHGIRAVFCGNPLADAVRGDTPRADVLTRLRLAPGDRYVAMLPGSRSSEQRYHRAVFEAVELPGRRKVTVELDEPAGPGLLLAAAARRWDIIAHADAAVVVSGTATLETALLGVPQVVCYHLAPVTRFLARLLVRTRRFGLPNILLGRDAVPELLEPSAQAVGRALEAMLADRRRAARARQDAERLRALLGPPGAADRIATVLLDLARGGSAA